VGELVAMLAPARQVFEFLGVLARVSKMMHGVDWVLAAALAYSLCSFVDCLFQDGPFPRTEIILVLFPFI
jgi:hypothetical protein